MATVLNVPTLADLCLAQITNDLVRYSDRLSSLPLDLADAVVKRIRSRRPHPFLHELIVLCEAFWKPSVFSLRSATGLNNRGLQYLSYANALVKLDLSGNSWLESVDFLPSLVQLECLNLRDCWRLTGQCFGFIQGLSHLNCLDMENVYSIADASASAFLAGMTTLRSLNLSGTGVGDGFLEALTYGQRMRCWVAKEQASKYFGATRKGTTFPPSVGNTSISCEGMDLSAGYSFQQWPPLELLYLKLQNTRISEASIPFLLSLQQLKFLDVRNTEIMGRSLRSIQAKYRLVSLPNNPKVLAHSNSIIVSAFDGACGCSSLEAGASGLPGKCKRTSFWPIQWEQDGVMQLLKEASRIRCASY